MSVKHRTVGEVLYHCPDTVAAVEDTSSERLLLTCIPHRNNHHKTRGDGCLKHTKEEPTRRQGTKVTPRRGQKQHTSPSNNTPRHYFGHARLLREEQPRVLSSHVGKVENTSEPTVLVRGDARVGEEVEDGCVGQRVLVDVLQHIGAHEQREEDHVDLADELFVEGGVAEEFIYVLVAEVMLAQECLCGVEFDDFAGGEGVELCHGDVLFCCCGFEGFVIGQLPCGLWRHCFE